LTSISSPAASFTYDGDGLRATKTYNGTTTYYLYDGDKVLLEETYNASTSVMTVTEAYGYAADGLRSRYEAASSLAYDYLYDPQGNVVQRQTYQNAENGEPAVTQAIYDAYGALRSNVLISTDATKGADEVGFGGQYGYYTDPETGLVLCTHRYYDPGAGRWLTRDPISYKGGMNLYSYAGGNPINEIDPEGYGPKSDDDDDLKLGPNTRTASSYHIDWAKTKKDLQTAFFTSISTMSTFVGGGEGEAAAEAKAIGKAAVKTVEEARGLFTAMGKELEPQVAEWLGRKGASVITDEAQLTFRTPKGRVITIFDGKIGNLLYEVKGALNVESEQKNFAQVLNQRKIAKSLNMNYRVFFKGPIPPSYTKFFTKHGISYFQLP
jgi:RHS repeat-associated protein